VVLNFDSWNSQPTNLYVRAFFALELFRRALNHFGLEFEWLCYKAIYKLPKAEMKCQPVQDRFQRSSNIVLHCFFVTWLIYVYGKLITLSARGYLPFAGGRVSSFILYWRPSGETWRRFLVFTFWVGKCKTTTQPWELWFPESCLIWIGYCFSWKRQAYPYTLWSLSGINLFFGDNLDGRGRKKISLIVTGPRAKGYLAHASDQCA